MSKDTITIPEDLWGIPRGFPENDPAILLRDAASAVLRLQTAVAPTHDRHASAAVTILQNLANAFEDQVPRRPAGWYLVEEMTGTRFLWWANGEFHLSPREVMPIVPVSDHARFCPVTLGEFEDNR